MRPLDTTNIKPQTLTSMILCYLSNTAALYLMPQENGGVITISENYLHLKQALKNAPHILEGCL